MGELAGKTVGIVGLGGIGAAIATRALAFDMDVVATRRTAAPSPVPGVRVSHVAPRPAGPQRRRRGLCAGRRIRDRGLLDDEAVAAINPAPMSSTSLVAS